MSRFPFVLAATLLLAASAFGQFKMQTPAGEAPGPWLFGTIGLGHRPDQKPIATALKGLALKVGDYSEAAVCYDLDLCRMAGGWTGGKFVTPMNLMSRGEFPTALAEPAFLEAASPEFQLAAEPAASSWRDPRSEPFGPLPRIRYRGFYLAGSRAVIKWKVEGIEVLESPWYEHERFTRTFQVAPSERALRFHLRPLSVGETLTQEIPPHREPFLFRLSIDQAGAFALDPAGASLPRLDALLHGGPRRWPEAVTLAGQLSPESEPYVVDTVPIPDPNPWGAPMFFGGFDFFEDGRAAVCTFHGDVFIVSGLDEKLDHVTWKRFASGLYHPLGLKIVRGEIYVMGRDGLTRLRDLDGDGEADFYEAFNWDLKVTKSFHEFVFDLQTDPDGNFYFAKAGPVKNGGRGFDEICEHHGTLLRVSADGRRLSVVATGFRAPNGIAVGPHGEITSGDNEGTWTPACRLNWVQQGGFYGVVDLAHRPEPPGDYDRPICWLPKRADNSSGGQVWVTSKRWGPWGGHLLHLSYGQCALFGVMMESVNIPEASDCCSQLWQGGVVKFPLKFSSGIMRARFNERDGQLYVAGLRGWQTSALKNGCLQRVRYTGAPVRMPFQLSARTGGIELKFTSSLDTQAVSDPDNWNVEVWNYIWSSAYGSPEISTEAPPVKPADQGKAGEPQFSPAQTAKPHHDSLAVKSVSIGTDDRTVFLEIPGLKPVMQMSIQYRLRTAEGQPLEGEVLNTIHALPNE